MDAIRTLLLERTHTVVLDPDRVANASTRPIRDIEIDRFEDELAQLGFVMSLDLAITLRRLPRGTLAELRAWIVDTLSAQLGPARPHVPLAPSSTPAPAPGDAAMSSYLRRVLPWLATAAEQPCPWCAQTKLTAPLDPCGHLVCRSCWAAGSYVGCPICHRRVAVQPFVAVPADTPRVTGSDSGSGGVLRIVHLGFDLAGSARARFQRMLARPDPLPAEDRAELALVIDSVGPAIASWLPAKIPNKETMAVVVARLWLVAPVRSAMVHATLAHVTTAADLLRVACVLMGGNPELVEPMRLRSTSRELRRAIVEALDHLPADQVVQEVARRIGLWKRVGERLHPFEWADRYPNAAVAFAVARETELAATSFGASLRDRARSIPAIAATDGVLRVAAWAGPIEEALRHGDPVSALDRLAQRPAELIRRADAFARASQSVPSDLSATLAAIDHALPRGAPAQLLMLASHVAHRGVVAPRRVFFPGGRVLRAWRADDRRATLQPEAIAGISGAIHRELVRRAAMRRHFARAVIDREVDTILAPTSKTDAAWPRGSTVRLPDTRSLQLSVTRTSTSDKRTELAIRALLYDRDWRHVVTRDGAGYTVDLDVVALRDDQIAHAVLVITGGDPDAAVDADVSFASSPYRLPVRIDAHLVVPLTIDVGAMCARYVDVVFRGRRAVRRLGGLRAAIGHLGRDLDTFASSRPTLWDAAAIHAAARANLVYVRHRGEVVTYRRRDGESPVARLARILAGDPDDGRGAGIPAANAPTWLAVMTDDFSIPTGSVGYIAESRAGGGDGLQRLTAADLVDELAPRQP